MDNLDEIFIHIRIFCVCAQSAYSVYAWPTLVYTMTSDLVHMCIYNLFRVDSADLQELAERSNEAFKQMMADFPKVKICTDFKTMGKGSEEAIFGRGCDGIHFRSAFLEVL